jgi:hypothetical protein
VEILRNYPKLEGWVTVTEAAEWLKISRQACHKLMDDGVFKNIHRLGNGVKPIYVIPIEEVERVRKSREAK